MARPGLRPVRRRRRLNGKRLLGTLAVLAVLAGLWQLERSPLLRVQHIVVTGGSGHLAALSGLRPGEPMWALDLGQAEQRLLARARYLRTATVRRRWPQTVEIAVTDRAPVAVVAGPGGALFGVDPTGRVLAKIGTGSGLPVLGGVAARSVGAYRDLRGAELPLALGLVADFGVQRFKVSEVVSAAPLAVYLPSGTEVLWPQGANVAGTIRELRAVLAALQRKGARAASIDLRVPSRPLVVLRQ